MDGPNGGLQQTTAKIARYSGFEDERKESREHSNWERQVAAPTTTEQDAQHYC